MTRGWHRHSPEDVLPDGRRILRRVPRPTTNLPWSKAGRHFIAKPRQIFYWYELEPCMDCGRPYIVPGQYLSPSKIKDDQTRRCQDCRAIHRRKFFLSGKKHGNFRGGYRASQEQAWKKVGIRVAGRPFSYVDFDSALELQKNACALCEYPFGPLHRPQVDHNRTTGEFRGLLCYECNYRHMGKFDADSFGKRPAPAQQKVIVACQSYIKKQMSEEQVNDQPKEKT